MCVCNGVLKNSLPGEHDVQVLLCSVPHRYRKQHCVMEGSQASPLVLVRLELRCTELSSIGYMILKKINWHARRKTFSVPLWTQISRRIVQDRALSFMVTDRRLNFRKTVRPWTRKLWTLKITYFVPHREHSVLPIQKQISGWCIKK